MSDEKIKLEYWRCTNCNGVYEINPVEKMPFKVNTDTFCVICQICKVDMEKCKRKPAFPVPNIGYTNTLILYDIVRMLSNSFENDERTTMADHCRYLGSVLKDSAEFQMKNRKLFTPQEQITGVLRAEDSLLGFWKKIFIYVEFK